MTQSKSGMWEQRFFTDGSLASSWGYQIDETASVIIGIYDHYLKIKDIEFLKNNFRMCERAADFLKKYVDDILDNKNQMKLSYDLWEEHEGISFYSLSAIYSAMKAIIEIDKKVKSSFSENLKKLEAIKKRDEDFKIYIEKLKEYAEKTFFDDDKKTFVRNNDDKKIDISLLGAVVPFKMIDSKDKRILNTVEKINMTLRTYTGGYVRYEDDNYMGGYNPWPIATLWMALYYIEIGEIENAKSCFDFVVRSSTEHGFLGEQVNNNKMESMWVIGLAWSHAMFIIVLEKLLGEDV
jgi:GH15 family glucan-1,4-alpha-glucosidase